MHTRRRHLLSPLLLALLATVWYVRTLTPALAETTAGTPRYFPETGHTLAYSFRQFYERNGSLAVFGLPLTEVYIEQGIPVQFFERARFEWHARMGLVQVSHLGHWAAQGREHEAAFQWLSAPPPGDSNYFPQSGHSMSGAFLAHWQQQGGLSAFGFPISEPFEEVSSASGQPVLVQYFERARFEHHPENPPDSQVLLGHLGREYLAHFPAPAWASAPVASAEQAWDGVRPTHVRIPRIGVDTAVEETGYTADEWEVPRWSAAHYWPIAAYPGTAGNIVLSGHVGYRDIIFNHLPEVQPGDEIFVSVGSQQHRYIVREVLTLLPHETWVMDPTPVETLTLITCVPIGVYSHRLIVRATPE